jgi:DNA-binding CsgD family transcriptional regulator
MGSGSEPNGILLERDRELERIGRLLRRGREGRGSALVVEGPAGIGKTALLSAARDMAEMEGFKLLRARGAELEREFAFGVARQLVEPALAAASEAERASLLEGPPGVAARLLALPGLAGAPAAPIAPDPSFAMLHGLYWLCVNLAAIRPLALVVDDAQWADCASLRFLAFLLPRLEELRVIVLLGARPAEAGESQELLAILTMDPTTELVTLRPLTTDGVANLVAKGLGAEPDDNFATAAWEATGGTPLLVHMLVDALRDQRISPVAASAGTVQGIATANLGRWAMLRLGQLGPDAAKLARAVAILERAELPEAARLAGVAPKEAARAAELLVRACVLVQAPLSFVHPLLRSGVYREIAPSERAKAHGQAARILAEIHESGARVAEHLLASAPAGDGWVVDQLSAAAREAAAAGAPESAAAYLRRALAEPPSPELAASVLRELGLAEFSAGQPAWHHHLEGAVATAADDTTRIAAALLFANALAFHQRLAEAVEVCDRVAASLEGREPEGQLELEAMAVVCGINDVAIAPSMADRAHALLERAKEPAMPRFGLAVAAWVAVLANEPAERAADLARRAVNAGPRPLPELGDPLWFPIATVALFWAEQYGEAQSLLDAAVTEAQATANGMILPAVFAQRAWLSLQRSDLTAAEADARALLEAPGLSAPPLYRLLATAILIDILVERGQFDEAERQLENLPVDLQSGSQTAALLRHARGRLRFAQRRFSDALDDFRAAGEIATRAQALNPSSMPWRSDAALAELALGNRDAARELSEEELELARAFGAPRALGVALRAAGLVAGGQRGEDLLREAVETLSSPDTRLEQARALTDLGALLRRSNRRMEAREMLRQAVDAAHRVGAQPLAGRAETELRATGAKPRRAMLTGLEALTASERRIAELAAEGLTNSQIAQTLFITARTVEGHLTNVFLKLGIKARTELPAALAAPTQAVPA